MEDAIVEMEDEWGVSAFDSLSRLPFALLMHELNLSKSGSFVAEFISFRIFSWLLAQRWSGVALV